MSENQKPEEPMIIKSDRPHSVSMPEGTNVAVGKKGEAGAPAVRKVMDGGVSQSSDPSKDVMAKGEVYKGYQSKDEGAENFKGYQSAADAPDRFAAQPKDVPIPPVGKKSIDLTQLDSILKTKASPVGADTVSNEPEIQSATTASQAKKASSEPMPEMNFPARVIKVKIENDQVRERLEKLE
jgi:hypothetical protein